MWGYFLTALIAFVAGMLVYANNKEPFDKLFGKKK